MNRYILNTDNVISFSIADSMLTLLAENEKCYGQYFGFFQDNDKFDIFLGGGYVLCLHISNMMNTPYNTVDLLADYLESVRPSVFRLNTQDNNTPTTAPTFTPPIIGDIDTSINSFLGQNP